ncbi:HD domain-containing protein [Liquorilactobacillus oeni]|uniref:HD superfamily hydrolase n=1 Tax=Liquorilactobacillus oeni DSM 19972 TaxID=1423777 RepID=A0A0R1MNG4_9LACO|nr:HD domain-containing protein [Liquorilactobacillus oeni]KRL05528.1 HD superfamily hydrolase [Liquorilactobacillus oeni DSM 19972]
MKRDNQLFAVHNFAKRQLGSDRSGHGFDHIERVVNMAKKILTKENADPLITLSAAYLHDVSDEKLFDDPEEQGQLILRLLTEHAFSPAQIEEITAIIKNLSFSKTLNNKTQRLSLAGQIVQDADRLDAIGAIGITRAIYYGGKHAETIYDPNIAPREKMTKEEYRNLDNETIINHFYEKLLKLKDMMNTKTAKKIAAGRQKIMLDYLNQFKAEWSAEK